MFKVTAMDPAEKADAIPSDVSLLWQRALDKYQESTGKDLEEVPRFTRVEDIFKDAELQQGTFNKFRHNGEMVDRLRSSVARNVNVLQSLQFVVDGAALVSTYSIFLNKTTYRVVSFQMI